MIPIASKITKFSLYLFVYFFENIISYGCRAYRFKRKNGWCASESPNLHDLYMYVGLLYHIVRIFDPVYTTDMN